MSAGELTKELYSLLEQNGSRGKIVPIEHLNELQKELEGQRREGLIDESLYRKYLTSFDFKVSEILPEAKCIIVVAVPQPNIRIRFDLGGELVPMIIPSTYAYSSDKQVKNIIEGLLGPGGYRLQKVALPLKLLAVCSGLAEYGKNNIAYIPDMGSFHRLVAFYTEFPGVGDDWRGPRVSERCEKCPVCMETCPTGAIASDRFLVRAEKCITFLNEGSDEFPGWLDPSWHNCLVGCLLCQNLCPMNKGFMEWKDEGEPFSREETALLLQGAPKEEYPDETIEKLKQLGLIIYLDMLGRNLGVLLDKER